MCMNLYPNLLFQINPELDKWTCNSHVFYKSVIRGHPDLEKNKGMAPEASKNFNDKYVEDYYRIHKQELDSAVEKMKNDWSKVDKLFFEVTNKFFGTRWPEGKYICYPSIFNCNPRFLETKEFQVFYKHPETTNYVCMHEMLHFIFYDYIDKNFDRERKGVGEKVVWKLSEIFNDVILRLPEFVSITDQKDPTFYAETEQELNNAIKLWEETKTVRAFVTKYLSGL